MNKPHTRVIVNPVAGENATYRHWPRILSLLKKNGLSFDYQFTEARGHGIELAKAAASEGYRYLVAVGGDGTIHEVANGILQSGNVAKTDLGVISTGTGSDLSRSMGFSPEFAKACSVLINPRKKIIDIGLVEYVQKGQKKQRYFVNSAGIGFDATVVAATESLPKFFGGTIPYVVGLLRSFMGYHNKPIKFKIGEKTESAKVVSVVVANGRYFGGGMMVAPQAQLNDGLLDILIIGNFGKIELLRNFPKIYKGTHLTLPKVRLLKDTRITIESEKKFLLHADGELLGEGPVSFKLIPQKLCLLA